MANPVFKRYPSEATFERRAQASFESYIEQQCRAEEFVFKGGSYAAIIDNSCRLGLFDARISDLKQVIKELSI